MKQTPNRTRSFDGFATSFAGLEARNLGAALAWSALAFGVTGMPGLAHAFSVAAPAVFPAFETFPKRTRAGLLSGTVSVDRHDRTVEESRTP